MAFSFGEDPHLKRWADEEEAAAGDDPVKKKQAAALRKQLNWTGFMANLESAGFGHQGSIKKPWRQTS